jgi:hypothetical protein
MSVMGTRTPTLPARVIQFNPSAHKEPNGGLEILFVERALARRMVSDRPLAIAPTDIVDADRTH